MKKSIVADAEQRQLEVHTFTLTSINSSSVRYVRGLACRPNGDLLVTHGNIISLINDLELHHTIFAGSEGDKGYVDGLRLKEAKLSSPAGICLFGDQVLFCDWDVNVIRVINGDVVSTFAGIKAAGHRDGPRATAQFNSPVSLIVGDNCFWISDQTNNCVRRICMWSGFVTTIGDRKPGVLEGSFATAQFNKPGALARLPDGDLLVTDTGSSAIRRIHVQQELVSTVSGGITGSYRNGNLKDAAFNAPAGIVVSANSSIFVADYFNHTLRAFRLDQGLVETLAGVQIKAGDTDGLLRNALLSHPNFMCFSPKGDLYWSESHSSRIRYIPGLSEPFQDMNFLYPPTPTFKKHWGLPFYFDVLNPLNNPSTTEYKKTSREDLVEPEIAPEHIFSFNHSPTGGSFRLFVPLMNAICPEILTEGALDALNRTSTAITDNCLRAFLRLLHGSVAVPHQESYSQTALRIAHIAFMCKITNIDRSWMHWAYEQLRTQLESMTCAESLDLIYHVAVECEKDETMISMICAHLRSAQQQVLRLQNRLDVLAFDPPLFRSVLLQLVGAESLKPNIGPDTSHVIGGAFKNMLRTYAEAHLKFGNHLHAPPGPHAILPACRALGPPNFSVSIQGCSLGRVWVHDWILRGKWNFFRRMEASRLSEWENRWLELPGDCPPSALLQLLNYIYMGQLLKPMVQESDAEWILDNAALFGLSDMSGLVNPEFRSFIRNCLKITKKEKPSPRNTQ